MDQREFYGLVKERFSEILREENLTGAEIQISAKTLSAREAIGTPQRKDFPILTGTDIMLEASFLGTRGQAFTDAPSNFSGTVADILAYDTEKDPYAIGLLIAAINAVMSHIGKSDNAIHCKNEGPELCARHAVDHIRAQFGCPKILVVGYQPALIENLCGAFENVRALDLNPQNIGKSRFGIIIESGATDRESAVRWSELILCTGSVICNGSIVDYLDTGRPILFFGTTLSGTASLLHFQRLCFADQVVGES